MAKQTDIASISLAISNSVTNQVDKLETLTIQIFPLARSQDEGKINAAKEAIKKAYDHYGLIVSTSIEKKAYEER
jgi:hypothetical protein